MKFRIKNMQATVAGINARKEGPDDDKVLAVDVRLQVLCDFDVLEFFEPALVACLYLDKGAVRNTSMGPIPFTHELEAYRLEICGSVHFGAKLKKFTVEPKDVYKVALCFQASFKPSSDEMAHLAEYLQDVIDVSVEPESEELDLGEPSSSRRAGPAPDFFEEGTSDPLYASALSHVASSGKVSSSAIQRLLSIGYNRASRLIEQMEKDGYVSQNSSGARELTSAGLELAA